METHSSRPLLATLLLCAAMTPLAVLTGCGGSNNTPAPTADESPQPTDAAVQPADDSSVATDGESLPPADAEVVPGDTPPVVPPADTGEVLPPPTPGATDDDIRQHVSQLVENTPDAGMTINNDALAAIEKAGPKSIELVRPLLADEDANVRIGAAFYLVDLFDENDTATVDAFANALNDENAAVRKIALQAIQRMPEDTQAKAAPQLVKLLSDHSSTAASRSAIARAIGKLGQKAATVRPQLIAAGKTDPDHRTRVAALYAASRLGTPEQAVEIYREVLSESDSPVVVRAALIRLDVLPGGSAAVKEVAAALGFKDAAVAKLAMQPLTRWGQPAVAPLTAQLSSTDVQTRQLSLATLSQLGRLAKPAQAAVAKLVDDPDPTVQKGARQLLPVLQKIGQ